MPPSSKLARLKLLYNTFLCGHDTEVDGPTQVWHVFAETSPSPACYNVDETKYSEEHLGCIFGPGGIFFDIFAQKKPKPECIFVNMSNRSLPRQKVWTAVSQCKTAWQFRIILKNVYTNNCKYVHFTYMVTLHLFIYLYICKLTNESRTGILNAFCSWMFVGLLNTKEKRPR